jgi:serpin B
MKSRMVNLKLPKFETATSVSMNDVLKGLGMTDAFDKSMADFGAMVNSGNVFISLIKQDSRFKIDEEGAEAAAITSVILDLGTAMPGQQEPVKFHADRPFIYLIQEKSSGAIFFAGVKCK